MAHEWKQTSEPGVICFGDTGFIIWYDKTSHWFRWKAPNGKESWCTTLEGAKSDAKAFYDAMKELGLTLS